MVSPYARGRSAEVKLVRLLSANLSDGLVLRVPLSRGLLIVSAAPAMSVFRLYGDVAVMRFHKLTSEIQVQVCTVEVKSTRKRTLSKLSACRNRYAHLAVLSASGWSYWLHGRLTNQRTFLEHLLEPRLCRDSHWSYIGCPLVLWPYCQLAEQVFRSYGQGQGSNGACHDDNDARAS